MLGENAIFSPNFFINSRWYVYELIDPRDGSVFYVGKGKDNRISSHEKEALIGFPSKKCNKIRNIWECGHQIVKEKVALFWCEEAAYDHETDRIEFYGLENLTNVMPGSRGAWTKRLEERKQRINKIDEEKLERKFFIACLGFYAVTKGFRENPIYYTINSYKEIPLHYLDYVKQEFFVFLNTRRDWAINIAKEIGYSLKISGQNLCLTSGHKTEGNTIS
jgi:hypothetical protein